MTANQVVATNLRLAREGIGWTQTQVAEFLNDMTGGNYTKATISAMERSAEGGKRRLFDAQEILEFARLFAKPMVWFFIPTDNLASRRLNVVGMEHGVDLLHFVFGDSEAERVMRERLVELRNDDPDRAGEAAMRFSSQLDKEAWQLYSTRRAAAIGSLLSEESEELERALDDLQFEMARVKSLLDEARQPPS